MALATDYTNGIPEALTVHEWHYRGGVSKCTCMIVITYVVYLHVRAELALQGVKQKAKQPPYRPEQVLTVPGL